MIQVQQVKTVEGFDVEDGAIRLKCTTEKGISVPIKIWYLSDDIIRMRVETTLNPNRISLIDEKKILPSGNECEVIDSENSLTLHGKRISIKITKEPWHLEVFGEKGESLLRESNNVVNAGGRLWVKNLGLKTDENGEIWIFDSFNLGYDESLYGFGEKFTPLNKRGQQLKLWNCDPLGVIREAGYKNVPFFLSTKGYGIFLNTSCIVKCDLGVSSSVSYTIEVADPILDIFLIYGPRFKDILPKYLNLTGRPQVPPKWSFGLWMSRFSYKTSEEVLDVAAKLRENNIPCDVINIDTFWLRHKHYCDFEWDLERFPDPKDLLRKLKEQNFKVSLWTQPYPPKDSDMFREGAKNGFLAKTQDGHVYEFDSWKNHFGHYRQGIVDFSNPNAARWYQDKCQRLAEIGIDVFKTDFGEEIPEDAVFANGLTGRQMRNYYPIIYHRTVSEITKRINGHGMVWARAAWAGSQKYPVSWGGDPSTQFHSLWSELRGGLSLALSGFLFWGHDIGGFSGNKPSTKLYTRWLQFGCLSSHSRCHGETPREPWEYGEEFLHIFREIVELRYSLLPYIYSQAHLSVQEGIPMIKPLVLEYQEDRNVRENDTQYLFGKDMLVAPLLSGEDQRQVYLPQGNWIDFWTHKVTSGPKYVAYHADLRTFPLFIRAGAIIPRVKPQPFIDEKPWDDLTLEVFPDKDNKVHCTIYDIDGVVEATFESEQGEGKLNISASNKRYTIKLFVPTKPTQVKINGQSVNEVKAELSDKPSWMFMHDHIVVVCSADGSPVEIYLKGIV